MSENDLLEKYIDFDQKCIDFAIRNPQSLDFVFKTSKSKEATKLSEEFDELFVKRGRSLAMPKLELRKWNEEDVLISTKTQ